MDCRRSFSAAKDERKPHPESYCKWRWSRKLLVSEFLNLFQSSSASSHFMYNLCQFARFGVQRYILYCVYLWRDSEINLKQGMSYKRISLRTKSITLDFPRIRKTDLNFSYLSTTIYSRNKLSRTIYSRNKFQLNQIS